MNMNQHHPDDYSRFYGTSAQSPANSSPSYPQGSEYRTHVQPPVTQKPPKQPFNPISLLLVAGVIFLFLGGVIFLTNTWDMLPDVVRALGLLSASLIAFGAHALAERIFRLQKTGLAFYILGCIFLPLALGGIGAFSLFGSWFSFHGDGAFLLLSVICLSISASTFLGQKHYQNIILVWIFLSGTFGIWAFFCLFFLQSAPDEIGVAVFSSMLLLYAALAAVTCDSYTRTHQNSYAVKAFPSYLYIVNVIIAIYLLPVSSDFHLTAALCSLILAVLFCNYRFIKNQLHIGIFGSVLCLITAFSQIAILFAGYSYEFEAERTIFTVLLCSVLLMSLHQMPKLRTEFTKTYSTAGMILGCLLTFPMLFAIDGVDSLWLLYPLLFMSLIFYFKSEENTISNEAKFFLIHLCMLFIVSIYNTFNNNLLSVGLVVSALILLMQALIRRKIWMLSIAVLTSIAVLSYDAKHPEIILLWLYTAGMLGGIVYANKNWRFTLERCCSWGFIAFLSASLLETLPLWLKSNVTWIMLLAAVGLLYLLESFVFWKDLRPNATKPYLEIESLLLSVIATVSYSNHTPSKGFGFVLCILLLMFSGILLRKNINAIALPPLIMLFITVTYMIDYDAPVILNVFFYMLLLIIYVVMGRLLLPHFYDHEDKKIQIDWALIIGILPIFGVASTIDWYPSILVCLFLAVYSLLYIGRVQSRFIPTLMASAFSCLTILFHNLHDPFELFKALHDTEMKTPQVLLYVLPFHLFILSLLWILPERYKSTVHKMRFAMYCFTMFWLLMVSLNFQNASDAILLMIFSFAILIGSFQVKKLRWFALGFSVLFLTTVRLTWKFWTSLHWGIYLFLAGIILIAVASYTEYQNRYYAEHPDEPKKKFDFFKTWVW